MKQRGLSSNITLNTAGTFAYFFCQWLLTVIAVRMGSYESAGMFSLAVAFSNILSYISLWGMRGVQVSDVEQHYQNGDFFSARLATAGMALVLFPVLILAYGYTGALAWCCAGTVLFKQLESVTDLFFGVYQRMSRYDFIAVSYILKGVAPVIVFAWLLRRSGDLGAAIAGMGIAYLLPLLFYDLPRLRQSGVFALRFHRTPELLRICFPLMLNGVLNAWMIYLPRHAVQSELGSEMLGYYGSISTVVVVLSTLGSAIWAAIMPQISREIADGNASGLRRTLYRIYALILCIALLALISGALLGSWAFGLIFGGEIRDHMDLLLPVILNAALLMWVTFFDCVFIPLGRRKTLLAANASGVISCAVTVTAATGSFGAVGACVSMGLGLIVRLAVLLTVAHRAIGKWNRE